MTKHSTKRKRSDRISGSAIVEVRPSLLSARDLRDGLATLSMTLAEEKKRGYLLLLDPELSRSFLEGELQRIKTALRPEVAERFHLVVAKKGEIVHGADTAPREDKMLLQDALAENQVHGTPLPPPIKKDEVFLVLLHRWVNGQGPVTLKSLEDTVGCNYRTVAAAIDQLGHAIQRHSDRSVSLKYFPEQAWGRLLAVASRTRSIMLYSDTSDQPRSPESLLRRLLNTNRKDIAIGGVIGSKHYYDDLDMVGSPRLDLCIHCPDKRVDLDFIRTLDPALEQTRDTHRPAQLVLHFIRRANPLFAPRADGMLWADPVECLLELYSARLDQQAQSFQEFLSARGRELSG